MPDRRHVLRALLAAGAAATLPAGCGIPTGGQPKVYGTGPVYDPIGSGTIVPLPEPDHATTPTELVRQFLGAVSGLLDNESIKAAHDRVNAYLTTDAQAKWKTTDDVYLLRVTDLTASTGADTTVSCTFQPVGRLMRDSGGIELHQDSRLTTAHFTVVSTANGYRISDLPVLGPGGSLPLSDDALNRYYTPQLIYFWDTTRSWLVPELRYVPRTVPLDAQLTQIVNCLLAGSADTVTGTLTNTLIPNNTTVLGRVTIQGGTVTVPFSATLQGADLERILVQVQWSMQPQQRLSDGAVELQIGGQKQQVNNALDRYRKVNLADASSGRADTPQAYYVVDKVVRSQTGAMLPPVLNDPDLNKDVQWAALSRDGQAAAVVTTAKPNRLVIGRMDRGTPRLQPLDQPSGGTWSRPVWLPSSQRLLVAVDGGLYAVGGDGRVSGQLTSGVRAFAVSPDGFRIALIQNDVLQVAALDQHAPDQPTLGVGNARTLDAGLTGMTAVAWSQSDRLVVAGMSQAARQWQLAEISIDGAIRELWAGIFNQIVAVVAYPKLPTQGSNPGPVLVQTKDNAVLRAYVTSQGDKVPPPDDASPSPSPAGAASKQTTAPFFPD